MRTSLNNTQRVTTRSSVLKRQQPTGHINNENIENGQIPLAKKRRMKESMETELNTTKLSEPSSSWEQRDDVDAASAPSVKALKGWLSGFEKQHRDHYENNVLAGKKTGDTARKGGQVSTQFSNRIHDTDNMSSAGEMNSSSSSNGGVTVKEQILTPAKSAMIRLTNKEATSESILTRKQVGTPSRQPQSKMSGSSSSLFSPPRQYPRSGSKGAGGSASTLPQPASLAAPGSTPKPLRFRPRVKKEEVQATDEKNASVHKLAEWLQDDPFEQRRLRAIRKGSQVIAKSRAFESDTSVVVAKDAAARQLAQNGSVADRQKWLRNAFKDGDEDDETEETATVSEKAKWLEKAFKKKSTRPNGMNACYGAATELVDGQNCQLTNPNANYGDGLAVGDDTPPEVLNEESKLCENISEAGQRKLSSRCVEASKKKKANDDSVVSACKSDDSGSSTAEPKLTKPKANIAAARTRGTELSKDTCHIVNTTVESSEVSSGPSAQSSHEKMNEICEKNRVPEPADTKGTIGDKENSADNHQVETPTERSVSHISETSQGGDKHNSVLQGQRALLEGKEGRSVLGVAAAFGGVTKLSSVQRRKLAFEQKGKEMRKKADPRSNMLKTTWESSSSGSIGNGSYTKKKIDHVVPKKALSDLP